MSPSAIRLFNLIVNSDLTGQEDDSGIDFTDRTVPFPMRVPISSIGPLRHHHGSWPPRACPGSAAIKVCVSSGCSRLTRYFPGTEIIRVGYRPAQAVQQLLRDFLLKRFDPRPYLV